MARGFLLGAAWGCVVSGIGLVSLSVSLDPPDWPASAQRDAAPSVTDPEVALLAPEAGEASPRLPLVGASPQPTQSVEAAAPAASDNVAEIPATPASPDLVAQAPEAPQAAAIGEDGAQVALATDPAAQRAGAAQGLQAPQGQDGAIAAPERGPARAGDLALSADGTQLGVAEAPASAGNVQLPQSVEAAPQLAGQGAAPQAPEPDAEPEVIAAIPTPDVSSEAPIGGGALGAVPTAPGAVQPSVPGTDSSPLVAPLPRIDSVASQDAAPGAQDNPPAPVRPAPVIADAEPDIAPEPVAEPEPQPEVAEATPAPVPEGTATDPAAPASQEADASEASDEAEQRGPRVLRLGSQTPSEEETETPEAPRRLPSVANADEASDQIATLRPRIGKPAGSLINRDTTARSTRLPQAGASAAPEVEEAEPAPQTQVVDTRPLARFAARDEAAADLPRLSVVLIDDGSGPLGPEAFQSFPFPVSFAIDPSHPRAAATANAYRERGFEVLALADVPSGATATDVEIALAGALDAVPQAVGVVEAPGAGLQVSRDVSEQATEILRASGHGLVMQTKGLNTAQQLAVKEGVPSATIFRDIDGAGESASAIRRVMAQGAFRAKQEGAAMMMGRLRADTLSALVLWGLQDRPAEVALVPASTVLKESAE